MGEDTRTDCAVTRSPLAARIVSLCDAYDALRAYRRAADHPRAASAILAGDGITRPEYFDPAVRSAFKMSLADFHEIFETLTDGRQVEAAEAGSG